MGYNVALFQHCIEEEFICAICSSVFEDPVMAGACEHIFCRDCIAAWLLHHDTCPVDRSQLAMPDLVDVPRIIRNLLSRQIMTCEHAAHGCDKQLRWDAYKDHLKVCEFDPKSTVVCDKGCGLTISRYMVKNHDCVRDLRTILKKQQHVMTQQSAAVDVIRRENQNFKKLMIHYRLNQLPQMRAVVEEIERDALALWRHSFVKIRPDWSRLLSPSPRSQLELLRHTLLNNGCPWYSLVCLVEHSIEQKWPAGIRTQQKRAENRAIMDCFVCRRLIGVNAIVVLAMENQHMTVDFQLVEPGILMLFRESPEQN